MARRNQPDRWTRTLPALAILAVFAVKLAVLLQLRQHPLLKPEAALDATAYLDLAAKVVGGNFGLDPGLYFLSPVYIYFLALVLWLLGSVAAVGAVQILLGTAAVVLVFRVASLWHGRRAAWIAGAFAALTGVFTFHEALVLETALDPFLTALALYLLAAALCEPENTRRTSPAALAGLAFGALALNRPQVFVAAAGLSLVFLLTRKWRTALLLTAGILAILAPVLARNYAVAGDLAPASSHGGLSFFIGNSPEADGTHRVVAGIAPSIAGQRDDARQAAEQAIGRSLDEGEVSAHFYGLAWNWVLAEPARAARLFVRKVAYVFNAAHPAGTYSYPYYVRDEHNLLRYLPIGPWILVPIGLLGVWLGAPGAADRRRAFWLWASFIPLFALSVAAFFVSSRHRLPLFVPLCVTAAAAVDALMKRRSLSAHRAITVIGARRAAVAVVALASLVTLAYWPFGLDEGRVEERTRMTLWLIGQERYDEAERRTAETERGHPQPAVLHFRIGRALLARGQTEAALRHLERSKALDPQKADTALVLGQALLEAGRPKDAIPHLRLALVSGPRPDLAGFDLARAQAATGNRAGAVQTLQAVRPTRSDDGESWRALGVLALELETPRLAEAFLRQAISVEPQSAESHEQLGLAVALSGRYDDAIAAFEQAVRLDARDSTAQLNLAVAYAENGRIADARRHAEESLRVDPSYGKARQFLEAIRDKKVP